MSRTGPSPVVGLQCCCGFGEVGGLPRVGAGEQVGQVQAGPESLAAQLLTGPVDPVVVEACGQISGVGVDGLLQGADAGGRIGGCAGLAQRVDEPPDVDVE